MNCIKPIDLYIKSQKRTIKVPCGKCLCCKQTRSRSLAWACQTFFYELSKNSIPSSFATLTYSEENVPIFGKNKKYTLRKRDFQLFLKRVRKFISKDNPGTRFKYLASGEYGSTSVLPRPHYHVIFFGLDASYVRLLCNRFWSVFDFGLSDVKPASSGAIGYVIKYCQKTNNNLKDLYDSEGVERPFLLHSIEIERYYMERNLHRIQDNNFSDNFFGKDFPIPSYFRKKYDIFKNFDPSGYLVESTAKAKLAGFSSLYDYDIYLSNVRAQQLIAKANISGDPIDRPDLLAFSKNSKGFSEEALDKIPF